MPVSVVVTVVTSSVHINHLASGSIVAAGCKGGSRGTPDRGTQYGTVTSTYLRTDQGTHPSTQRTPKHRIGVQATRQQGCWYK